MINVKFVMDGPGVETVDTYDRKFKSEDEMVAHLNQLFGVKDFSHGDRGYFRPSNHMYGCEITETK